MLIQSGSLLLQDMSTHGGSTTSRHSSPVRPTGHEHVYVCPLLLQIFGSLQSPGVHMSFGGAGAQDWSGIYNKIKIDQ